MRKRLFSFIIICILLVASSTSPAAEPGPGGLVQLEEKEGRLCGTPIIAQQQQLLIENTRRLSPELPAALAKEAGVTHVVGDTLSFFTVDFSTSAYSTIKAVCREKTAQTYIFVGAEDLASNRVSEADIADFKTAFESRTPAGSLDPNQGIYSLVTGIYGPPPNRSGDGYVYILIHDIKDNYDPDSGKRVYIAGYFSPTDQTNGTYSNRKDLINVDCYPQNPSHAGALATVAHEFQHLIHHGQDADEDEGGLWVNEGASEYSEVLCGYSLRMPTYYLLHPERSLTQFNASDENLWDYQKVALWSYYLAEKFGPELIGAIVKDPKNSLEGVRSALIKRGITLSFEDIFSNFAVANYADNPALGENSYYSYDKIRLPSLPASTPHSVYPLKDQNRTLPNYSMGYYRFTGEDSTAVLHLQGKPGAEFRARIYAPGATPSVQSVALDATNTGQFPLNNIGVSAEADVLTAISLGSSNAFTYAVTSDLTDRAMPTIFTGPQELIPTGTSTTITWNTDERSTSLVEYGLTSAYGSSLADTALVTSHLVTLTGLQPNTTYHYRVGSIDAYGNGPRYSADFQFRTASGSDNTIAVVEQSHSYAYSGRSMARTQDGTLHLLYHQVSGSRRFVYHKSTADNGATWSDPRLVDESLYHSGMPAVAADHLGRLHVAWHARAGSADDKLKIYYSRSDDNGLSWSAPVCIGSHDQNDLLYAAIAADAESNPHVVCNIALYDDDYAGDIYYAGSGDGGRTWNAQTMISSGAGDRRCHVPVIDITPAGEIWVAWTDGLFDQESRKIWHTRSTDHVTWSSPAAVTTSGVLYDRYPSLVIDDRSVVHLAYTDNYTPGDIRIMYIRYDGGSWSEPIPVAQSTTGNVSAPSLTCDSLGVLYLVYRDDQGSATLGRYASAPAETADGPALAKPSASDSDIFFALCSKGGWLSGGNISSDDVANEYPETPRRVQPGALEAIWMRTVTTTDNRIQFLHLQTKPETARQPLGISVISPEADAGEVSYFKQFFFVQVDFNQRVISDSITAATFRVTSASQGPLVGFITYDQSLRRLLFQVNVNLLPEDLITVWLSGSIPQEGGVGLDGNGNGIAEGSPADDFSWSFRTGAPDLQAPAFTIGIAQNPVLNRYMDIYLFPSEVLLRNPAVEIGGSIFPALRVPGEAFIYKADYRLDQSGVMQIKATGEDLAGNLGQGERLFTAQFMLAESGGTLSSPDGRFSLQIGERSLPHDLYLTLVPEKGVGAEADPEWVIGPERLSLARPVQLRVAAPAQEEKRYFIEQKRPDGSWKPLPGAVEEGVVKASAQSLGTFRLASVTQVIPRQFGLHQNYPNPFRRGVETTTFHLDLPLQREVEVAVYNLLGERIRLLTRGTLAAGVHTLHWDGRDENRNAVASGVYFYRCVFPGGSFTRKMLILQ